MIDRKTDCIDCYKRDGSQCTGYIEFSSTQRRELPPAPFSGCIIPIIEQYKNMIKPGYHVLEIGCGAWSPIKKHCEKIGATYEGIDTEEYYGNEKSVATRIENLTNLSFNDEQFDFVFGNQTMEHWEEYGCDISWGLSQCFRVCKTNGIVAQNVPIHFHGTKYFVNGDLESIRNMFRDFSNTITINSWGMKTNPLPPFFAHPNFLPLRSKSAYALDILAIKNKTPNKLYRKKYRHSGIIARFRSYPFFYFSYLVARKIKNLFLVKKI
jgi:SAM-dependent methyltransferase